MKTWNTYPNVFEDTRLNNLPNSSVGLYYGSKTDDQIELIESSEGAEKQVFKKHVWTFPDDHTVAVQIYISDDNKTTWFNVMKRWEVRSYAICPKKGQKKEFFCPNRFLLWILF